MLRINERISIPLAEFQWEFSRSGGPGGQNVNKVNSKVELTFDFEDTVALTDKVRDTTQAWYATPGFLGSLLLVLCLFLNIYFW